VAPPALFYAQVVKIRNTAGHVVEVNRRVVFGGPRRFGKQLRLHQLGTTIQTSLHGTLVWHTAGAGGAPAAPYSLSVLEPRAPPGEGLNWLRVSGTTEVPQIDQGVRQQYHAKLALHTCLARGQTVDTVPRWALCP
jgi:hypothetical protein